MTYDLKAELDEIARKRTEEFLRKQAAEREERAAKALRRKYGKAAQHALRLERGRAQREE